MERDLNLRRASDALGLSVRTLRRRVAAGELQASRDGKRLLISENEIRRYRDCRQKVGQVLPRVRRQQRRLKIETSWV